MKALFAAAALVAIAIPAAAQGGGRLGQRQGDEQEVAVSPAEIQRMFDSYALMQAQEQLQIPDERFAQFLTRFKAFQEVRRRAVQDRARHLLELRRLLSLPQPGDAAIRQEVTALDDLTSRAQAEVKRAVEAIDQLLSVKQQAKFRMFEEMMERRKLELVSRARQANRVRQK